MKAGGTLLSSGGTNTIAGAYPNVNKAIIASNFQAGYSSDEIKRRIEVSKEYYRLMNLSKSEVLNRVNTTRVDYASTVRNEPKRDIVLFILNNKYGSRILGKVDEMGGLLTKRQLGL